MPNKIIPYRSDLKLLARELRKNSTSTEILLWQNIKQRALGVQFHRQVPMLDYILDFYCHEIGLVIELDGSVHDHSFLKDAKRQGELEARGVQFLRFTNKQVKTDLFNVLIAIREKVYELKN